MLLWEDGQQRRMDTRHEPGHDGDATVDEAVLTAPGQGDR
jgi:hypothetical protein